MFVELPIEEAYAPLWASLKRLSLILLTAWCLPCLLACSWHAAWSGRSGR